MRFKTLAITCLGVILLASSCIKKEGPDREADVLEFTIDDPTLLTTIYDEHRSKISLILQDTTGYHNKTITPQIKISGGAVISPADGEPITLKDYKHFYTVTAESGETKNYQLFVEPLDQLSQDFEKWYVVNAGTSHEFLMPTSNLWVNANEGVRIVYRPNEEYPTSRSTDVRPGSKGEFSALLQTVKGNANSVSDQMDIPVFAGNMFRGVFEAANALKDPLGTTKFGQPHPQYMGKPLQLRAWYKYKSGSIFTSWEYEGGKKKIFTIADKKDEPDLYAVLFKVPKGKEGVNVFLSGRDVSTSDKIVATAFMDMTKLNSKFEWTEIRTNFTYKEQLDYANNDYKLAIVLASSTEGANYRGSIGSTLLVDDLTIITDNDEPE